MSVAFSPDSQLIATGSDDQTIRLWRVNTGECIKILEANNPWIDFVSFSPDGSLLASRNNRRIAKIWEVKTGRCLKTLEETDDQLQISINANGDLILEAQQEETSNLWDVHFNRINFLKSLRGSIEDIKSVAVSSDMKFLVSGNIRGIIQLLDVELGICLHTLKLACLYEGMNITGAKGLTEAEKATLKALGASDAQS